MFVEEELKKNNLITKKMTVGAKNVFLTKMPVASIDYISVSNSLLNEEFIFRLWDLF